MNADYIVVGSGPTGAQAAQTLVEAGVKVLMLDVGNFDKHYSKLIPDKDFLSIRKEEEEQHRYFLGDQFEGIQWGNIKVGSQLTPPRKFVVQDVEKWLPVASDTFTPMESLAYGGLGNAWGTGCHVFSSLELAEMGVRNSAMHSAYETIAQRIGISGEKDDANPYCLGHIQHYQPSIPLESHQQGLAKAYQNNRKQLHEKGFFFGRTALAVLTKDMPDREKVSYKDMDFWSVTDSAAYRPWITVEALKKHRNFSYKSKCLVLKFEEKNDGVDVHVLRTDTNEKEIFHCKKLVLSPGVLGTARIVMRSFNYTKERLPIISNPYCYMPCLQPRQLGKPVQEIKSSFGQLVMFQDKNRDNFDVGMAALFTYRSLLLFKLIKEAPLNFANARSIMQYLQSSFVIAGVHHPERGSDQKYLSLQKDKSTATGDKLIAHYQLSEKEEFTNKEREKQWIWAMRQIGCYALKRIYPGHGSSIHYAGTLPYSNENQPYSLLPTGQLGGSKNVFVADGSGFKYLPAKGLTLTLMANAHLVALNALKES